MANTQKCQHLLNLLSWHLAQYLAHTVNRIHNVCVRCSGMTLKSGEGVAEGAGSGARGLSPGPSSSCSAVFWWHLHFTPSKEGYRCLSRNGCSRLRRDTASQSLGLLPSLRSTDCIKVMGEDGEEKFENSAKAGSSVVIRWMVLPYTGLGGPGSGFETLGRVSGNLWCWRRNPEVRSGDPALRKALFGLILCCHHLEVLNDSFKKGLPLSFCRGPCKLCRWSWVHTIWDSDILSQLVLNLQLIKQVAAGLVFFLISLSLI